MFPVPSRVFVAVRYTEYEVHKHVSLGFPEPLSELCTLPGFACKNRLRQELICCEMTSTLGDLPQWW